MVDLIIKNGPCFIEGNLKKLCLGIFQGKIVKIESSVEEESKDIFEAVGLIILPGCIDTQVHFREPGSIDSEDLNTGSRAAVAGGITGVFEMPNTNPPTSNKKEFQNKLNLAKNRMYCNYAFYFGATPSNYEELSNLKNLEGCCGVKLFAGSSTGDLLVDKEEDIEKVFKNTSKIVSVHSEDEEILKQRKKLIERAEIKDCIAYLRVVYQNQDDLSFERIINVPKRSIGETTLKQISKFAKKNKLTLEVSAKKLIENNEIKPKTKLGLTFLLNQFTKWRDDLENKKINHIKLLQIILDESGYSQMLKNKKDLENENRIENIKELLNAMKEFDNLESFLEHVSLATSMDKNWEGEKINLMSMHASKGLEFDVVFLPGWEEGLFPHQKSIEEKVEKGLVEVSRLAYVGITRAKKIANISFSMNRFYQGDWIDCLASRFIDELPEENIKKNNFSNNDQIDEFEFNQDIEFSNEIKSPGWTR